jgi:hypothetical protein
MNLVMRHGGRVARATTKRNSGGVTRCFDKKADDAFSSFGRAFFESF